VSVLCASACGARGERSSTRAAVPSSIGPHDREKQDIQDLWMQIREWRVEMQWGTEPPRALIRQYRNQSVHQLRVCPANPQPQTNTCRDVCNISEAICDNAESICRIAGQLAGDSWAQEKCENAKASCKEATERCCKCVLAEDAGDSSGGASTRAAEPNRR
jgi:hypothetical protein